jgi:predicted transcriptional regulator
MSAPIFQMREYTMNEVNPLCQILKILHRKPCSQVELCEQLGFSKSHMHKLVSNLVTPGIIKRSDSQFEANPYKQSPQLNHRLKGKL